MDNEVIFFHLPLRVCVVKCIILTNVFSLNTVYILMTVLAEMTTYSPGQINLHCSGLMRDDFAIEYYGLGDGKSVLLYILLRSNPRTRRRFRNLEVIIRDVSDSKTE